MLAELPTDPCLWRQCIVLADPKPSMLDILLAVVAVAMFVGAWIGYLHWKHEHFAETRRKHEERQRAREARAPGGGLRVSCHGEPLSWGVWSNLPGRGLAPGEWQLHGIDERVQRR